MTIRKIPRPDQPLIRDIAKTADTNFAEGIIRVSTQKRVSIDLRREARAATRSKVMPNARRIGDVTDVGAPDQIGPRDDQAFPDVRINLVLRILPVGLGCLPSPRRREPLR